MLKTLLIEGSLKFKARYYSFKTSFKTCNVLQADDDTLLGTHFVGLKGIRSEESEERCFQVHIK